MEERWIILASYARIPEANQDADTLKEEGVNCQIIVGEPGRTLSMGDSEDPWIYLEVLEVDFELAADILELEPSTIEDFDEFAPNPEKESRRRSGLYFWGGLFSLLILARLLSELMS